MSELKNCPSCGGEAEDGGKTAGVPWVRCTRCTFESEAAHWNRRAPVTVSQTEFDIVFERHIGVAHPMSEMYVKTRDIFAALNIKVEDSRDE